MGLLGIILFLADAALVCVAAGLGVALCRLPGRAARCVGLLLGVYGLLVVGAPLLSVGRLLASPWAHLAVHGLCLLLLVWLWRRAGRPALDLRVPPAEVRSLLQSGIRRWPDVVGLAVIVAGVYAVNVWVLMSAVQNSSDSMGYHLARVGFWLQEGSIAHGAAHDLNRISIEGGKIRLIKAADDSKLTGSADAATGQALIQPLVKDPFGVFVFSQSGKTYTLVKKFVHELMRKKDDDYLTIENLAAITFTVDIEQTGTTQLEAWFGDATGEECGAYYVSVERLAP